MKQRVLLLCWALFAVLLLTACSKAPPKNEASSTSISGYNYTSEGIQEFYVNGAWGGAISIGGGGATVCCINLPDKWTPGLKVMVEWERSDCGLEGPRGSRCPVPPDFETTGKLPPWQHKKLKEEVAIEPFEKSDTVQVFFLPNDEVKIYVSSLGPGNQDHPAHLGRPHPLDNPNWKDPQ